MNKAQKIASLIALAVFVLTLCNAPWDVAHTSYQSSLIGSAEHSLTSHHQECSPIWNSPRTSIGSQATLQVGVLVVWWLGIAVIYAGLFFILKWKPAPKIGTQPLQPVSPLVQLPTDSPLPAEPPKTGNVFSRHKVLLLVLVVVCCGILALFISQSGNPKPHKTNTFVQQWRKVSPNDTRSDDEITLYLEELAPKDFQTYPDAVADYNRITNSSEGQYLLAKQEAMRSCEIFDASLQYSGYSNRDSDYFSFSGIQGRVKNTGAKTVVGFTLRVLIYAPDKTLIDTEHASISQLYLAPGDVKQFSGLITINRVPKGFTWTYSITDCDVMMN